MKSLFKSVLRIALLVLVLVEIVGTTCIDWLMFHPEMVRETYAASAAGYVNLGEGDETIADFALTQDKMIGDGK